MNAKNIKRHLTAKIRDWTKHIDNEVVRQVINDNTIITGGALVSLLTGEPVNDYDIYFKTKEACVKVAEYYVRKWNEEHPNKTVQLRVSEEGRVSCFISSDGIVENEETKTLDDPFGIESEDKTDAVEKNETEKEKYKPRFITSNAITLSNKLQIVTRFYGDVEEIHKNYDFAHCTCAWSSWNSKVFLPEKALECIINKELFYVGSKYPLCSIIRTRKYIQRGYSINAGQYLKMAMQLNELNLKDVNVLEDQLTGVDTAYFQQIIQIIRKKQEETNSAAFESSYVVELVNKLF